MGAFSLGKELSGCSIRVLWPLQVLATYFPANQIGLFSNFSSDFSLQDLSMHQHRNQTLSRHYKNSYMSDSTGDFDVSDVLNSPSSHTTADCESQRVPAKRQREDSSEAVLDPGSEDYRRLRKRRQNRESAARTRARRVDLNKRLQGQVCELERTNCHLQSEVQRLNLTVATLQQDLDYYRSLALELENTS